MFFKAVVVHQVSTAMYMHAWQAVNLSGQQPIGAIALQPGISRWDGRFKRRRGLHRGATELNDR